MSLAMDVFMLQLPEYRSDHISTCRILQMLHEKDSSYDITSQNRKIHFLYNY